MKNLYLIEKYQERICVNCGTSIRYGQFENCVGELGKFCTVDCQKEWSDAKLVHNLLIKVKPKKKMGRKPISKVFPHKTLDIALYIPDNTHYRSYNRLNSKSVL